MPPLKRANTQDVKTIAPLFDAYRQFYGFDANRPLAEQFVFDRLSNEESVIWVAYDAVGRAVGFTQMYPSFSSTLAGKVWILYDLFVSDSARGQGYGRQLMHAAINWAESTGAVELNLATATDNVRAQKLYASLGFERDTAFWVYALDPRVGVAV